MFLYDIVGHNRCQSDIANRQEDDGDGDCTEGHEAETLSAVSSMARCFQRMSFGGSSYYVRLRKTLRLSAPAPLILVSVCITVLCRSLLAWMCVPYSSHA